MTHTLKYAVADDDPAVISEIISHLSNTTNYKTAYCAGDGHELLREMIAHSPDLLIIDLYMPYMSGHEAISLIRNLNTKIPIIAYSNIYQQDVANNLRRLNVLYCKRNTGDILLMADVLLHNNKTDLVKYLKQWENQTEVLIQQIPRKQSKPAFTNIELQLLAFTYDGFSNKEIGTKMKLSPRTVDTYIGRLLEKTDLRNKLELAKYASENGMCKRHCEFGINESCSCISIFKRP